MALLDYAVIGVYLLLLIALGSSFASRQTTASEYFLISRTVPWWAVCFTVVATETSTLTFIGIPAQTYAAAGNFAFLQLALGYIVGRFLISALFIPKYFARELLTSYEVLHERFGAPVRNLGSAMFLVTRSAADGIRLFATSAVIATLVGVPVWVAIIVLGVAMIVYTFYGGAAAVIWTDVIQMFVYLAGALIVFWFAVGGVPNGLAGVLDFGAATGRFTVFDFDLNFFRAYTFWAGIVGGITLTLATHGTDQFLVQRLLTARSQKEAQWGLSLSGLLVFLQFGLFLLLGVALAAFYQQGAPPDLSRADMLIPTFVRDHVPVGLAGFVVAAIVAAALSPSINSLAATTVNDFYLKYWNPNADDRQMLRVAHRATVVWGIVQIGVALLATQLTQSVLDAGLSVLGLGAGPVLGAFLVALLRRRVPAMQVATAMVVAWAVVLSAYGFAGLAWPWYSPIGAGVTVALSLIPSRAAAATLASMFLVLTAACGNNEAPPALDLSGSIEVSVEPVRLNILRSTVTANGEIAPHPDADQVVSASELATIQELPVEEGQVVQAGDVLVRFEVPSRTAALQTAQLEVAQAAAQVEAARARVIELSGLLQRGLTPRMDVDNAKSALAGAESILAATRATVTSLEAAAARDVVRARFPGVVIKRWHFQGDTVVGGPGDPVVRVADPTRVQLVLDVPTADAGKLIPGQQATVTPLGFAPVQTSVQQVGPTATNATTTRVVLPMPTATNAMAAVTGGSAEPDAPTQPAQPGVGTPVIGDVLVAEIPEALVIPSRAILRANGATYVLTAGADGRVARKDVRIGLATLELTQVLSGLEVGDLVITSALTELNEGDRVRYAQ